MIRDTHEWTAEDKRDLQDIPHSNFVHTVLIWGTRKESKKESGKAEY
jgi:hypothetical protein